jgi:hypothetical protein
MDRILVAVAASAKVEHLSAFSKVREQHIHQGCQEKPLAESPVIAVLLITLDGDSDAPATDGTFLCHKFSGKRMHRIVKGIGHNPPQEAPQAFTEAIVEVDGC